MFSSSSEFWQQNLLDAGVVEKLNNVCYLVCEEEEWKRVNVGGIAINSIYELIFKSIKLGHCVVPCDILEHIKHHKMDISDEKRIEIILSLLNDIITKIYC